MLAAIKTQKRFVARSTQRDYRWGLTTPTDDTGNVPGPVFLRHRKRGPLGPSRALLRARTSTTDAYANR